MTGIRYLHCQRGDVVLLQRAVALSYVRSSTARPQEHKSYNRMWCLGFEKRRRIWLICCCDTSHQPKDTPPPGKSNVIELEGRAGVPIR